MADGQLPYPSATTGKLRLRVWSVCCVDCSDRASVLPQSDSTATALALPVRVPRPRPLQKKVSARWLSGSRGRARAFQSGSNKARKPPSPTSPDSGGGLGLLPGTPLLFQQWPPTTAPPPPPPHSLTPTEDCMLSAAEKLCLPVPRRRRGPLGLQALSGVGRSLSDLGVPRPGLGLDNLSRTHSSVPPLRGHPLLKLQQLNFIHNFSSSLSLSLLLAPRALLFSGAAPPRLPPRLRQLGRRHSVQAGPPLPPRVQQAEGAHTDRQASNLGKTGQPGEQGRNDTLPMLPHLVIFVFICQK